MSEAVHKIARSKERFKNIVWPEIKHWFADARLVPVESVDTRLAEALDTDAGVDWLAVLTDSGIVAIASRVQKMRCFETTTVRVELCGGGRTELQKRREQLRRGMVTPTVTVHSYVKLSDPLDRRCTAGELRNAAVHPTAPLYDYIDSGDAATPPDSGRDPWEIDGDYYTKSNGEDGNRFAVIPWKKCLGNVPTRVWDVDKTTSLPEVWQSTLGPQPTFGGETDD